MVKVIKMEVWRRLGAVSEGAGWSDKEWVESYKRQCNKMTLLEKQRHDGKVFLFLW